MCVNVNMWEDVCVCVNVNVCVYVCRYVCANVNVWVYVCMYVCVNEKCVCVCVCVWSSKRFEDCFNLFDKGRGQCE